MFDFNKKIKYQGAYQEHIAHEKIFVTRMISVLGMLMFIAFFFIDLWAFSNIEYKSLIFTRSLVVISLSITFSLTFSSTFFRKYSTLILPIPYLIAILGINYIISLGSPSDIASYSYFAGLMLVIMLLFSWSFLKTTLSLVICFFALFLYSYVVITTGSSNENNLVAKLIIDLAFLLSAAVIGIVSQYIRDRHLSQIFYLQQSLKESLKEKTIEANDYEHQANHDALTLLPNRRYITALLEESLQIAKEKDKILAILFFDLNGFKQINDIYGHAVGDEVLVIVAKRLELAIRKGDHISRLGGDEYLVGLMMDKEHVSEITSMAEKFTAIISEPMRIDGDIVKVGTSVGIAAYPMHGNNINVLIDIADKKMYNIKQGIDKVAKKPEEDDNSKAIVIFPSNSKKLKY